MSDEWWVMSDDWLSETNFPTKKVFSTSGQREKQVRVSPHHLTSLYRSDSVSVIIRNNKVKGAKASQHQPSFITGFYFHCRDQIKLNVTSLSQHSSHSSRIEIFREEIENILLEHPDQIKDRRWFFKKFTCKVSVVWEALACVWGTGSSSPPGCQWDTGL